MGMTLREIIFNIGGGIRGGKKFKAVQTGGPSGGCLPESLLDLAVDFDQLTKVGSMMGSGGMIVMDEVLTRIIEAHGQEDDIELMEELGEVVADASLCALGGTAPNPVLSAIRYFRSEYESHIRDHKCPAGVCNALITYTISDENCTGCHLCFRNCPADAISGEPKETHVIDQNECIKCGMCHEVWKFDAVQISRYGAHYE